MEPDRADDAHALAKTTAKAASTVANCIRCAESVIAFSALKV
jgi:hypothetical protein